jgi:hypothetical protein
LSGTAGVGVDFEPVGGTLTFTPGQTKQNITVNAIGDTFFEGNEVFSLELGEAANASIADTSGACTIIDDESSPILSVDSSETMWEGQSGQTSLVFFQVRLSTQSANQVTVQYKTSDGTATATEDYQPVFGTLLFAPGQRYKTVAVSIIGDNAIEDHETFYLDLSNPTNASIANARGVAFIINDDPPTVQLSQSAYSIGEAGGSLPIQVNRTDAMAAATVDYGTADTSGLNACSSVTGIASSRCDYATTIGTLRFAVGESSKTIYIPVIDDNIADGTEIFTLTLSNPSGASLGTTRSATITITDNANTAGNPIDGGSFFIREHYIDFLGREPEPAGLAGWLNVYNNCGTTVAQPCDRIEISSAFFRSEEFQTRAYFIYRFYSAVGKIPLYEGFMPDFAKVSGFLSAQELEANKVAFVNEFMTRPDYQTLYGPITDNDAYVTAVLNTLGLPSHPRKTEWVTALNGGSSRATVLRAVTEDGQVYSKYYNEAFVIMQYFGYLRRSADISYLQWIQTMNSNGGNYREMINGFLNSAEYRQRFGQ